MLTRATSATCDTRARRAASVIRDTSITLGTPDTRDSSGTRITRAASLTRDTRTTRATRIASVTRVTLVFLLPLLMITSAARGEVAVSSALGGYCRVGRYAAVEVSTDGSAEIRAAGVVPVRIDGAASRAV